VWTPQFRALKNFEFSGVLNLASGRPYTAVFDQSEVNFSVVPGEGFNSFRGPTVKNVDFSVSRIFRIGERYSVGVMAEAFDLFNHPNYQQNTVDNVQYSVTQTGSNGTNGIWTATANPDFGAPLAVVPRFGARSFQFSTRFSF